MRLRPLTRGLLILALLNTLAANLALALAGYETTLHHVAAFLVGSAEDDSWEPMRQALAYLREGQATPLYQAVFFDRGINFIYPPSSLLPLELVGRIVGQPLPSDVVMNRLSWVAIACTAVVSSTLLLIGVRRHLWPEFEARPTERWLLGFLGTFMAIGFYPIVKAFTLGQAQTFATLLFALATLAWVRERKAWAGALCGGICLIKPQLGLLLVWGLLRHERRFVAGWLGAVVPLGLFSLWHYGVQAHLDYVRLASFVTQHSWSFYANQSVNGLLNRLLFNGTNLTWDPRPAPFNSFVYAGTVVSSLVLVATALFWRRQKSHSTDPEDFFVAALSFTMASPVAWEHHYGVMLPILACLLPAALARREAGVAWHAVLPLAISYLLSSNFYALTGQFATSRLNIVQSYVLAGAVLLLMQLYRFRMSLADGC